MKFTKSQLKQIIEEELAAAAIHEEEKPPGVEAIEAEFETSMTDEQVGDLVRFSGIPREQQKAAYDYFTQRNIDAPPRDEEFMMERGKMKLTKNLLEKFIKKSLYESRWDREYGSPEEDETNWRSIPDQELGEALRGAIYDLFYKVHNIRPRWIYKKEMSIEELEQMHHELTRELDQSMSDERRFAGMSDEEWEDEWQAEEAERELMMTPEEGEGLPKYGGMGAARSQDGTWQGGKGARKRASRLREFIEEELEKLGFGQGKAPKGKLHKKRLVTMEMVNGVPSPLAGLSEEELEVVCAALHRHPKALLTFGPGNSAYEALYKHYEFQMPYEIISGKGGEMDTSEWILSQLDPSMIEMCEEAFEMTYMQEGKPKRRS